MLSLRVARLAVLRLDIERGRPVAAVVAVPL
jgi:hypothetical protein